MSLSKQFQQNLSRMTTVLRFLAHVLSLPCSTFTGSLSCCFFAWCLLVASQAAAVDSDEEDGDALIRMRPGQKPPTSTKGKSQASAVDAKPGEKEEQEDSDLPEDPTLRQLINESEVVEDDFLKDYLSKKIWRVKDADGLPSYKELVGEDVPQHPDIDEDEDELDRMDDFEAKFNFRFQDPDAIQITTHARDQTESLRKKDTSRKEARERKKLLMAERTKKKEEVWTLMVVQLQGGKGSKNDITGREGGDFKF
jgi:hypothetical protein